MIKSVRVSVPGKIHFVGEHVVLYEKPAILAAINKRCFVKLTPRVDEYVKITSNNFNKSEQLNLLQLFKKTQNARDEWEKFLDQKDTSILSRITKNGLDYPLLAVGHILSKNPQIKSGFNIEIDSEIPIGSGCGSSSAIAVSIAGAFEFFLNQKFDLDKIFKTAVEIEEFKHGTPSGGDVVAVLYGGFIWFENKDSKKSIKKLDIKLPKNIVKDFYLVNSGIPDESTGVMIGIVREFKNKYPKKAEEVFADQEKLTNDLVKNLTENNTKLVSENISKAEKNLEKLGVVSDFVKEINEKIEESGGAVKILGGGGKTKGSGMLFSIHSNYLRLKEVCDKYGLTVTGIEIGVEGLRKE